MLSFLSGVVITCALHAQGRRFEPGRKHCVFVITFVWATEIKDIRGHTDLNHGPIGLQPIALPLSYIPNLVVAESNTGRIGKHIIKVYDKYFRFFLLHGRRWYNGQHSCLPSS